MKNFSLTLFLLTGFLAFATSLHAQTPVNAKAEKTSCQKPCSKANAYQNYVPVVLVAAASEEKASTPNTTTAKEKAACQKVCTKTVATKANCDPKDCPPECLPPNCKIVPCTAKSTAVAINQKPGDQK